MSSETNSDDLHTAAVCVYPARAKDAIDILGKYHATQVSVASGELFRPRKLDKILIIIHKFFNIINLIF